MTTTGTLHCLPSKCFFHTFLLTRLVLLFGIDATDYTQLWNDMRQEISLVIGPKSALPGQGSFGHITGGYDAGAFYVAKTLHFSRFRR